ncbi:hypothetical protein V6N12_018188 [Hibiscus sabdariffa]|uniref:Protein kinase domain-containing protein n=1 Tax=Hibiscus sabdariffa TaxID=183260 RepID=A0ABR2BPM0_9ROSI
MDWLSPVLDIVIRLCRCSPRHVFYIRHLEENLDKLRDEREALRRRRCDILQRVETAEKQPRTRRTEEVEGWMQDATTMDYEVNTIIREGNAELQNKCIGDCCPRNLMSTYKIGKRVFEKIDSVTELLSKADPFRLDSAIVLRLPRKRLLMPEWPLENTVGLDSAVEKVWKAIENETVRIIRLCGQGGVGKTTLLKKVCNGFHRRSHDFDAVIWVMVPTGEGYIEKVQEVIRKKLDIPDDLWNQCSGEDEKGAQIFRVLKGKKFVFLLDNVWEPFDLIRLGIQLWSDHSQSKVIFTARSLRFYLNSGIEHETIEVKCLPTEQALSLFRMTVGENVLSSDPYLSELANTLARKCRGLPLALLAFAGAVAGLEKPRQWHHTIELSHTHPSEIAGMGGHVLPLLKISYDNLKEAKDQKCFLYCSLFPEDYNIRIDELINLWVGEGFLDGSNPCDHGGSMVEALKSAYLLETGESEQCVKMHDIIRHMALWLARDHGREKNKVLVAKSGRLTDRELRKWEEAKRISLFGCISTEMNISHSPSCPYLTTLLLRDGELKSFPDGFFNSMPTLKVLDLSGNRNLVELPSDIGNAKTLQYLNLSFTSLAELPTGLGNLGDLKCLLLDFTWNLERIPKELISGLFLLQVYSKIIGLDKYLGSVESLPSDEIAFLEVLECLHQITKIGITIFWAPSLGKILQSYTLRSCIRNLTLMECPGLISIQITEVLINLERLEIFRCSSLKELEVTDRCKLDNLRTVRIGGCLSLLNLNSLAYLTNLETLSVFDCMSLKEVTTDGMGFRKLKTVSFTRLQNLNRICPSSSCFPSLLEIEVSKCPLLRQLPFDLETANFLQKIRGETEWWDGLIWDDEAIMDVCGLKFSFTSDDEVLMDSEHDCPYFHPAGLRSNLFQWFESWSRFGFGSRSRFRISRRHTSLVSRIDGGGCGSEAEAEAIIEMETEESVHRQIAEKLRSIRSSRCPHVVVYHDSFYNNGAISLVLEYMDGGSLADFLIKVKSIPEPYIAAICKQVLKGLIYLHHEAHVIHRDINPSKLLINCRGEVKITDFVESAKVKNTSGRANTFVGTYNYMSPERIVGDSYGIDADIWSLGLLLLECATGKFPYSPPEQAEEWTNFYELMECIVEEPAPYAPSDQFSPEFCSFISACLQKEPKNRKSAQELLELPFMKMYDGAEVDLSSYFSSAGS